jgi:hypothetical protein
MVFVVCACVYNVGEQNQDIRAFREGTFMGLSDNIFIRDLNCVSHPLWECKVTVCFIFSQHHLFPIRYDDVFSKLERYTRVCHDRWSGIAWFFGHLRSVNFHIRF